MNVQTQKEAAGRIVQNGGFCFDAGESFPGCERCGACLAKGYTGRLLFAGKFLIEDIDYVFVSDACVKCRAEEPFVEILCFSSINAIYARNGEAAEVLSGTYIYSHQAAHGELRFSADVPIRGVRIVIKDRFFRDYLIRRFPRETLDIICSGDTKNAQRRNPKLHLIFSQIRDSIRSGMEREIYYESKIIELLCVLSEVGFDSPDQSRLSGDDKNAVAKVKTILENQFFDAPKIAQLAILTGTSASKLQSDFKAALGCTIHDYLQAVRMAKALDMVENTETPLYVIAKEVGCKKAGRFAEIFKNTCGVSPDIHRRNFNG